MYVYPPGVTALFFAGLILSHYNSYNLSRKSQVRNHRHIK